MRLQEYLDNQWKEMSIWKKIDILWYRFTYQITIRTLVFIGKCPHDAVFGGVGQKYQLCLDCKKEVYNEDWKEDRKALQTIKKGK